MLGVFVGGLPRLSKSLC